MSRYLKVFCDICRKERTSPYFWREIDEDFSYYTSDRSGRMDVCLECWNRLKVLIDQMRDEHSSKQDIR